MPTETLEIRMFDFDRDIETVKEWWSGHEAPVPLELIVPDDGLIVPGICAAWLYLPSNSNVGWIGWPVANPSASPREVHNGFQLLLEEMKLLAQKYDMRALTAATDISGLIKVFKRVGFRAKPEKMTSLWTGI